jgi:hypothetical protein
VDGGFASGHVDGVSGIAERHPAKGCDQIQHPTWSTTFMRWIPSNAQQITGRSVLDKSTISSVGLGSWGFGSGFRFFCA